MQENPRPLTITLKEPAPHEAAAHPQPKVGHLLIYQSPACFTDPLTIIDMLLQGVAAG